jgi:hypothetical protein
MIMASKYSSIPSDFILMMLAPVGYAMVEFSRVPLALATRTQRNHFMKIIAALAVLCAAGVTVKSVSMLGEIMFRPRLEAVAEAKRNMEKINRDRDSIALAIKSAEDLVAQRKSEREAAEQQLSRLDSEIGKRPGQNCSIISGTDRNGKDYRGTKCTPDPAILALKQQLQSAGDFHAEASRKLEEANVARNALSAAAADKLSANAEANYREALFHSQLHSFTSMVFGKGANQVTESEVAAFLRIFVFLPAIFVALASTLLAMTAVNHIKPKRETAAVPVPDAAVIQILRAAVLSANSRRLMDFPSRSLIEHLLGCHLSAGWHRQMGSLISQEGQKHHFDHPPVNSGLLNKADMFRADRQFAFVPKAEENWLLGTPPEC